MQQLNEWSQRLLEKSLAPSTKKNYNGALKRYEMFCHYHFLSSFPLEEKTLILFVTFLATYSSYSNTKLHLAALRYHSIMQISPSPIKNFQKLYYVLRGIKRLQGKKRKKPLRAPITPAILNKIQSFLVKSTKLYEDKVMLWAAILTAFFGFLRVSEYTSSHKTKYDPHTTLLLSDVCITEDRAKINIKTSKTDPFREGVVIELARNGSNLCPISALSEFLQIRPSTPGPFFRFHNGKFLSRGDINKVLKESTDNHVNMSSHSLRIGAASTAAAMGCPKWLIQFMGRWTSDCYRTYLRIPKSMIDKTSRALARCSSKEIAIFHPTISE